MKNEKSKHTPGPWNQIRDTISIASARGLVATAVKKHNGILISNDEMSANARLIAAAPELLAALEQFLSAPYAPMSIDMARAAIAKARGEK